MTRIFIKNDQIYSGPLEYILSTLFKNKSCRIELTDNKTEAQLIFDHTDPASLPINTDFYDSLLNKGIFDHEEYFKNKPYILFPKSDKTDWLSTAFYMINSFQEYSYVSGNSNFDNYGRFRFDKSYQHKYNCIEENIVQRCFENFIKENPVPDDLTTIERKTKIFLSHDIDSLCGSFLQDGLWAIKRGRPDIVLKLIMNEILLNPHWRNIDKIVKLHSEYDLKSTFFWLATKKPGTNKVKNADYSIKKINESIKIPANSGLHKSSCSSSIDEELQMLPFSTNINRFHFLKFSLPKSWNQIGDSRLQLDASLGYAERYGFRNSYGLPFQPYQISAQKPYRFIEVPLNIMDGTLHRYMKIPLHETASTVIDFIEKNKTNAVISLLWHNTYFTNYKYAGYLQEYVKVMLYLKEAGIQPITPQEMINEFKITK